MRFNIILLLFLISQVSCFKNDIIENYSTRSDTLQVDTLNVDTTKVLTLKSEHPRILLLKGEEEQIRTLYNSDDTWKKMHDAINTRSNYLLTLSVLKRELIGFRMLWISNQALERMFYFSYSYRMTGEKKYLDGAVKIMNSVSNFSDWNPQHFLDVAEMTMAVSIGYDWLYDDLPDATREAAKKAILEKGLRPSMEDNYDWNWWLDIDSNWNQVCNAGMVFGALAIQEDYPDLADSIIDRAFTKINIPMAEYEPDGVDPEGYAYWGYGTTFNALFISAVEKYLADGRGKSLVASHPGFMKTGDFMKNMIAPTGKAFNWSDSSDGELLNPAMFWFAQETNTPSVLWSEKQFLKTADYLNITSSIRYLPAIMIWGKDIKFSDITEPDEKFWKGQGKNPVAFMRSSWSDKNAVFMGLKLGSPDNNHGHMDVGSFVMEANDVRWAIDLGLQNYESLESIGMNIWSKVQDSQRWDVFRMSDFSHNVLIVDNQKQIVKGYAKIDRFSDNENFMFSVSDISSVYNGQLKKEIRGVGLKNLKYTIVRDEFETLDKITTIRWQMVTNAVVKLGNRSATLTEDGKTLQLMINGPENIKMKTWTTDTDNVNVNGYDAKNPGTSIVGFECDVPANTKDFYEVLMVPGDEKASFSDLTLDEW